MVTFDQSQPVINTNAKTAGEREREKNKIKKRKKEKKKKEVGQSRPNVPGTTIDR